MKMCEGFELVNVAEENIVVPVGNKAESFQGLVVLNEAAAFLVEKMRQNPTMDELVALLIEQYDVEQDEAYKDVEGMINSLKEMGLISD